MHLGFQPGRNSGLRIYLRWAGGLILAAAAWGQAAKPAAHSAPAKAATASPAAATIGPNTPVITIPGMCDKPAAEKSKAAACKTVVTRAEFEQLVNAVAPAIDPASRKQLATQYGTALVMVHKAHEMGLDRGPRFQELMRVARIGVITKELGQKLQQEAENISDTGSRDLLPQQPGHVRRGRPATGLHTAQQAASGKRKKRQARRRSQQGGREERAAGIRRRHEEAGGRVAGAGGGRRRLWETAG